MKNFAKLMLALSIAAVLAAPAAAMDLNAQITQLDGNPLVDQQGKPVSMTLADVIANALLTTDAQTPPEQKGKRFWLAIKVRDAAEAKKDLSFTPQELTEIENLLNKYQSILVAGQAIRMIDPTFKPSEK